MNKKAFIEAMKKAENRRSINKGLYLAMCDNAHNEEKAIEADINRTETIEAINRTIAIDNVLTMY